MSDRFETFQVGDRPRIELKVPNGSVRFRQGSAGSIEVRVGGSVALLDSLEIEQQGDLISLFTTSRRFSRWSSVDADIAVPEGTEITVRAAGADVRVDVVPRRLTIHVAAGDVRCGDVQGDLFVKSASGDVVAGEVFGRVEASTAAGDIAVGCVHGSMEMTSAAGDIRVGTAKERASVRSAAGDIKVRRFEGPEFVAKSMSGDVAIGFPEGRSLSIDLQTLSGDVNNEFPVTSERTGKASVRVKTVSGDITLESSP